MARRVAERFAVITGGGTGGHVVPAIAIGRALVARGHAPEAVHFVGSQRGIESRLVPEAGFSLTMLPGRGLQRRLTAENIPATAGMGRAVAQATRLLRRERPRIVISVGGYASVACAMAAVALRIPLILHEQNAAPGAANRMVARFARACAVSFPGTPLPRSRLTGNPVRPEVLAVNRAAGAAEARAALGLPVDRRVVGVFGGSLGSLRINRAVLAALPAWAPRADLAVHHVVGERDWALVTAEAPPLADGGLHYQAVRYEDRMPLLYAAADLFVCRAGGNTVAELAAIGAAAILVPLPGAPSDHQTANARVMADAGAATLVRDAELDGARLQSEVEALLGDADRLGGMSKAASALGRHDAADQVAALAEEHARG